MPKPKVKYVQLEPTAFLSDSVVQIMTAEEVGVYCLLCFNLYDSGGKLKYDLDIIRRLCKVNGDFDFKLVLSKFQVRRGFIYHKRVTEELRKAQVKRDSAVKAAKAKWDKVCGRNADASPAQCQGKGREGKGIQSFKGDALELCKRMTQCLKPTKQDAQTLAGIVRYLEQKNPQYIIDALEWLAIAKTKRIPIAYFIKTVQRETGWSHREVVI
jgi:uncharacterized protein YdaU (DUF1376 family)